MSTRVIFYWQNNNTHTPHSWDDVSLVTDSTLNHLVSGFNLENPAFVFGQPLSLIAEEETETIEKAWDKLPGEGAHTGLLEVQAGTQTTSAQQSGDGVTKAQLMQFQDTEYNVINNVDQSIDPTRFGTTNSDDDLQSFLKRPVKIFSTTVKVAEALSTQFKPWKLFLDNKRVINRINNFNNLRCNLHLKFMINGNGFYFGKIIASYRPLNDFDLEHEHIAGEQADIMLATQRPHVFLDPCMSTGGELRIPFFWYKDSLNIPNSDWDEMGVIYLESINKLKNVNGATTDLTISVFAWADQATFDSPTINSSGSLTPQAGEYDAEGVISRPATMLANVASTVAPYMGPLKPFAMAMSEAAGLSSKLAKLYGFSRPVDITPAMKMQPRPIANLANYDTLDTTTKLSLDTKQEITIDTRVMGLGGNDELSIDSLVTRTNYLGSFDWKVDALPNTRLTDINVWPYHKLKHNTENAWQFPSYAIPMFDFRYWRGTFNLKIEVACSNFHKGRILIVYDPSVATSTPETNVQYSYVMDLADSKEMTIQIPWAQSQAFKTRPTGWQALESNNGINSNVRNEPGDNGVISIFVLNELTSPSSSTEAVAINLYGSFNAGFKVFDPNMSYSRFIFKKLATPKVLEVQGGDMTDCAEDCQMPDDTQISFTAGSNSEVDRQMTVYAGEDIRTMRALMKRPTSYMYLPKIIGVMLGATHVLRSRPRPRGYSTQSEADGFVRTFNSFLTFGSYAYSGFRGGTRFKAICTNSNTMLGIQPSESILSYGANQYSNVYAFDLTSNNGTRQRAQNLLRPFVERQNASQEQQHTHSQQCVEAELPYYSLNRFTPNRLLNFEGGSYGLNTEYRCFNLHQLSADVIPGRIEVFASIAEDFQLGFYIGLPLVTVLDTPTVGTGPP